jgi:putative oxidoreductase
MSLLKTRLPPSFVKQTIKKIPDAFLRLNINAMMKKIFPAARVLLRFALGAGFILPVLDRFGVLGTPRSANVSWGDWTNFVTYTNTLMPYFSVKTASFFGLIATIGEAVFGVLLLTGYKIKLAAYGSFGLTLAFALSMLFFTGYRSPFDYSVFSVSFASLLLASLPPGEKTENQSNIL